MNKELNVILPPSLVYDAYFFDLDGTIYVGDKLLPGVATTISYLRKLGKPILFLTNTTTQTRLDCQTRLRRFGLDVELEEIVTAAFLSAQYFKEMSSPPVVLAIGERALEAELQEAGVQQATDPLQATHVLVGMDRSFDYNKLHEAMKAVRNGAMLIAANPDPFCPVIGDVIPDTWSMVKAIEAASSGEIVSIIGKPSAYFAKKVIERVNLPQERCLMVGDRLETDILFGINNGIGTALVMTGVTSREDLAGHGIQPDYVISNIAELCS